MPFGSTASLIQSILGRQHRARAERGYEVIECA
jgi:hypothetical protein